VTAIRSNDIQMRFISPPVCVHARIRLLIKALRAARRSGRIGDFTSTVTLWSLPVNRLSPCS
jgi:hypothetical protein